MKKAISASARLRALAVALLLAVSLSGCSLLTPSRADVSPEQTLVKLTTPTIKTKGVLTVGYTNEDAPQVCTDANGNLTGYAVDVARAIAKSQGLSVTFVSGASADDLSEVDLMLGATTDDSSGTVSVAGNYLEDAPALFTKASADGSAPGSLSVQDLSSATIAVQDKSQTQDVLAKCGISAQQKTYSDVNSCLDALAKGEVQYAACDATAGAYLARAHADIVFAGAFDSTTTYGLAMKTTNAELVKAIGDALSQMTVDGTLDAIHQAWYGSLPMSLSDATVSGITTSAARKQAEEAAKRQTATDTAGASSDGASADGTSTSSTDSSASTTDAAA